MAEQGTTPSDIGKFLAGGGISGAVVAGLFILYKCCERRRFNSKCCGGEMTVGNNEPTPVVAVQIQASPELHSKRNSQQIPPLELSPAAENTHNQ
jgi:hypothetical protein